MSMLLAGDIGGTKTTLGLFTPAQGPRRPLRQETYASTNFPDLETMVGQFLGKTDGPIDYACFGVAGPIREGQASLTNLPWIIEERQLSAALSIPAVLLLNDLAALAESIPLLKEGSEIHQLRRGNPAAHGNRAMIAPGTGLGEAFSGWSVATAGYRVFPSEGGHCNFAPRNAQEEELLAYLRVKIGHVSYENICSGPGIQNIYHFLRETRAAPEPPWLREALSRQKDPTPLIIQYALDAHQTADICTKTLDIFISALGAEAGNLVLKVMATGGVYLGGGIPRRILSLLAGSDFIKSFMDKGRFQTFMARIPIHVILHPDAALIGAAHRGLAQALFSF